MSNLVLIDSWFEKFGQFVDILAISVDSFDEETNKKIGRGKGNHVQNVSKAAELCRKYGINSVSETLYLSGKEFNLKSIQL